jgi:hypothetical protein
MRLRTCGVAGVVEHVRVDAQRGGGACVPEQPADLHDVQADVEDQVTGVGMAQVVEAQARGALGKSRAANRIGELTVDVALVAGCLCW